MEKTKNSNLIAYSYHVLYKNKYFLENRIKRDYNQSTKPCENNNM